jgi:hypothetical protein
MKIATRSEIDERLLADQIKTSKMYGYDADRIESVEQMADYIRERFVDNILGTLDQEAALTFLISDLEKMKLDLYDFEILSDEPN